MEASEVITFIQPILLGFLVVGNIIPLGPARAIAFFGGIGLGMGIHSLFFFISYILQMPFHFVLIGETVIIIALGIRYFILIRRGAATNKVDSTRSTRRWLSTTLSLFFIFACINTIVTYFPRAWQKPHGDGDAYMCWNLKARYMFKADESTWQGIFTRNYTHPDYPLLVPGAIAANWEQSGRETLLAPILVHFFFAFSVVGLLYSALQLLRSGLTAKLGALFIMCTPFFILSSVDQFSDLPLSFFYLLSFVLLAFGFNDTFKKYRSDIFALTGMSAALTAWTKNEGVLFFAMLSLCIAAAFVWFGEGKYAWRPLIFYFTGAMAIWIVVLYFKIALTPANDLVVVESSTLSKFLDISRYLAVARSYFVIGGTFGQWLITPIPAICLYVYLSKVKRGQFTKASLITGATIFCLLGGYFFVYIGFYFEHIGGSMNRLFLQLLPAGVFLFCLVTRTPEEILADSGLAAYDDYAKSGPAAKHNIG